MMALLGLAAGAVLGHALAPTWGAIVGGLAGFLAGAMFAGSRQRAAHRKPDAAATAAATSERALRAEVVALRQRVAMLETALREGRGPEVLLIAGIAAAPDAPVATAPAVVEAASPRVIAADGAAPAEARPVEAPPALPCAPGGPEPFAPQPPATVPAPAAKADASARPGWLYGGNLLTRVGVVVLFVGVAFLLRYFSEHFDFSIEWKLGAVAVGALGLIGMGMRSARSRPGYGVSLQGGGAGILYLTAWAAYRLYELLPGEAALAVLLAIAALTIVLALRADSQPLAALAIAGGFLGPLLTTGDGAPLPLFGFLVALDGAIFFIALSRAWRGLNVLGLVGTVVSALAWGWRFYAPAHYALVQPSLLLLFAFYVTVAVLEARRSALDPRQPLDSLLVFGTPLAGFALQMVLMRGSEHGAAISALVVAAIYALLFVALARRGTPAFVPLARAFLGLAVFFTTLAVPLGFDLQATSALWAIEAAGVYWLGIGQRSPLARSFALLLLACAGAAFLAEARPEATVPLYADARMGGALLLAVSGLLMAYLAGRAKDGLAPRERALALLAFAWGAGWWQFGGALAFIAHVDSDLQNHAVLAWVLAGTALALALSRALAWPRLAAMGLALLPAMAYVAAHDIPVVGTTLQQFGWLLWPVAWALLWRVLFVVDRAASATAGGEPGPPGAAGLLRLAHSLAAVALTAQVSWEASEWVGRSTPAHTVWVACAVALPAIAALAFLARCRDVMRWPFATHGELYATGAGTPIAAFVMLWFFAVNILSPGDSSPLPYVPLANPLDATLALAVVVVFGWARRASRLPADVHYGWLGAGIFVAVNGMVLRTAHHWGGIAWRPGALLASRPLQAGLTLAWTLTAVALMVVATRRRVRPLWMVGAVLLAAVAAKLFLLDLTGLAGLTRIVAFLGVGVLLLAIGWWSPLPPVVAVSAAPVAPPPAR